MRKITSLLIVLLLLTSCYDYTEIEDTAYINACGIDYGEENLYRFTFEIPEITKEPGQKGTSAGDSASIFVVEAASVVEGLHLLDQAITRRSLVAHCKKVVVSEEIAREDLAPIVYQLQRFFDIRNAMAIIISKQSAMEYVKNDKPNIGDDMLRKSELLALNLQKISNLPAISFGEKYSGFESTTQQAVAMYGELPQQTAEDLDVSTSRTTYKLLPHDFPVYKENGGNITGLALFKGYKMVDVLPREETWLYACLINRFNYEVFTLPDPLNRQKPIALRVFMHDQPQVTTDIRNNSITVKLNLEGDLEGNSTLEVPDARKYVELINRDMSTMLEEYGEKIFQRTQRRGVDTFGFGGYIISNFLTIEEWEAYDWDRRYPGFTINLDVNFELNHFGILAQP